MKIQHGRKTETLHSENKKKRDTKRIRIDNESSVTIMPFQERIVNQTEIQKITNRYQDVNKNEVKFRRRYW